MGENFRELRQKLHEKRHFFNNLKLGIGNWGIKIPGKKSKFWKLSLSHYYGRENTIHQPSSRLRIQ